MPKTVIIADDHPFIIDGMESLIREEPGLDFIGRASNGIEAIALIKKTQPDCALLDLSMPGANGLEVFLEAKRWSPKTRFVIITGISAAALFHQLYDVGIDGLFVKNEVPASIIEGVLQICDGKRIISPEAMQEIENSRQHQNLTKREIEVLNALAEGLSNKAVADKLGVSPKTVDTHRTNLLRKMNVNTTAALLVKAMREGLLDV